MPNRWAVANGNWSSTATWNSGGTLGIPTGSDDVFANNFTVNVDTSFQVLSIRNTASASAVVAGGTFNFNSGSISASLSTGSALTLPSTGSSLITVTATAGTVTIIAPNVTFTTPTVSTTTPTISHTGNCDLIISCSSMLGVQSALAIANVLNKTSAGSLTITCPNGIIGSNNVGNFQTNNDIITVSSGGTTILNANLVGGNTFTANSRVIIQTGGSLTVNGNVVGALHNAGAAPNIAAVINSSANILTINGNISLNPNTTLSPTIIISTPSTVTISGSVEGSQQPAINTSQAVIMTVRGTVTAGTISPAIISSNASAVNIFTGPFINTNNTMAVQCVDMMLTADASTSWNFGDITLFSPGRLAFYPSASDIRQGTTYADGTVSGSLAMPPSSAVIAGTPTDNTTGSAVLTPVQLQDAVWGRDLSQMTETGSIGHRLARVSTTGTTGAQIASYLL